MIGHLLTESLWYSTITRDRNDAGDPRLADAVCIAAMIERRTELVIDDDGNERQANHMVATEIEIPAGAFVWFDDVACGGAAEAAAKKDRNQAIRRIRADTAKTPSGFRFYETRF